ncbi:MAG: dephospho-CoA kinase [Bacteroidetes bacterium]|nr:dephospho-CoA kinase [Bacteroidota bacterium]
MISIGITGGIGSGKTTVSKLFQQQYHISVFDADSVAKKLAQQNSSAKKEIEKNFGSMYDKNGILLHKKLAEIVFSSSDQLEILNSIIHPLVFKEFLQWKSRLQTQASYCLAEAALLFESGMDNFVDYSFSIIADEAIRISRIIHRDTSSPDEIARRMQYQLSNDEHKKLADFILENNGTPEELTRKVLFYHTLFSTLKEREAEQ